MLLPRQAGTKGRSVVRGQKLIENPVHTGRYRTRAHTPPHTMTELLPARVRGEPLHFEADPATDTVTTLLSSVQTFARRLNVRPRSGPHACTY